MRSLILGLAGVLLAAAPTAAQTEPQVLKLRVEPAAAPTPALKYRLLPEARDLKPGNAAVYYQRAHSPEWYGVFGRMKELEQVHDWLDLPAEKVPWAKIDWLADNGMLKELDRAARTEGVDWQFTQRVREEGPTLLIPDVQGFRMMAYLLAMRARLEMRQGKQREAIESIQTGLALGRHLADAPVLLNYLVANAIINTMLGRAEELIQQPGAPNLYWALTDLPDGIADLRRPLQGERLMVDAMFPGVRKALSEAKPSPLPTEELLKGIDLALATRARTSSADRQRLVPSVAAAYPEARQYFLDRGRAAEDLDALPVTQVVLMRGLERYDHYSDDVNKLLNLPYWQARPRLKELKERRATLERDGSPAAAPVPQLFAPDGIFLARARTQRRVDLLRTVEAIRLYAAKHGRAPDALEDIREVPVPLDPVTGKAFGYHLEDGRAVLTAPPPPGEQSAVSNAVRVEITLAPRANKTGE